MLPAQLYTILVITIWCMTVLYFLHRDVTQINELPFLILAYGISIGPWEQMLSHDVSPGGNATSGTLTLALAVKIAPLVSFAYLLFGRPETYAPVWIAFLAIMGCGVILASWNSFRTLSKAST